MNKGPMIFGGLLLFIGGLAIGNLIGSSSKDEGTSAPSSAAIEASGEVERYNMPVTDAQPTKGPKDALVTIVEVSDFECPFCKRVGPTIAQITKTYGDKVRFVWRNNPLPFHQKATPAAQLALEAFNQGGNDKFWAAHDLLFENQQKLDNDDLEGYAAKLGLDVAKFKAALESGKYIDQIKADQEVAARFDARGTPAFFINGRKLMGAQPFEAFKQVIDDEISRAEKLIASGVAKGKVSAELTKTGKERAEPEKPKEEEARKMPDPNAVYAVPVGNEPSKGPKDALVTIVEVSDFECPFCSRVLPTLDDVRKEYGDDVRIVWFNNPLPFHKNATPAAQAALEAYEQGGNDKFWKMHDLLFENQRELTRENLDAFAAKIGLNAAKFKAALDGDKHTDVIKAQQQLVQKLGASGTPSFFINGRNLRGAQPLPAFKAIIDEELKKAKDLVASGTAKAKVYDSIVAKGAKEPKFIEGPSAPAKEAAPNPDKVYNFDIPKDAPVKGNRNAKVIIQEFSDFECPFCSRVNPTMAEIEKTYGNKVAIIWRHYPLPFHQNAQLAHEAAQEVYKQGGDKAFWAYHDKLFENQRALTRPDLEKYASEISGINLAAFKKALDANTHKARVQADLDAVTKAGAQIGTPSFFINGKLLQGAQPFEQFKAAIEKAL